MMKKSIIMAGLIFIILVAIIYANIESNNQTEYVSTSSILNTERQRALERCLSPRDNLCVRRIASKYNDTSICENILSVNLSLSYFTSENFREDCKKNIGSVLDSIIETCQGNFSIKKLEDEKYYNMTSEILKCYFSESIKENDERLCYLLGIEVGSNMKENAIGACRAIIGNKLSVCYPADNSYNCIYYISTARNNSFICNNAQILDQPRFTDSAHYFFTGAHDRIICMAMILKDPLVCEIFNISQIGYRDACYSEIATILRKEPICNRIYDTEAKYLCKRRILLLNERGFAVDNQMNNRLW